MSCCLHSMLLAMGLMAALPTGLRAQSSPVNEPCGRIGVALQVLGSGGPELAGRASASYLIWQDGKARVLVDAGAGSALRFREAGAKLADLDLVLLSHLHADHSADLPALIKSALFERRRRVLPLFGPEGGGQFPATTEFVRRLVDPKTGAFAYLSYYLKPGLLSGYELRTKDAGGGSGAPEQVFKSDGIAATVARVVHADVPALTWRVEIAGKRIAFSGDGNGRNGNLEKIAEGVDLLVAHLAVPEGTHGDELDYHMDPSLIGRIAAQAGARSVVLAHRMTRTLGQEDAARVAIAKSFSGAVMLAEDLSCYPLR